MKYKRNKPQLSAIVIYSKSRWATEGDVESQCERHREGGGGALELLSAPLMWTAPHRRPTAAAACCCSQAHYEAHRLTLKRAGMKEDKTSTSNRIQM